MRFGIKSYIMEVNIRKTELQEEEINQKVLDKIAFNCPHCHKEINETHLDEKGKYFQYIKEKIRKATEEEVNYQKSIQKKQLLEQIEVERGYEEFAEVVKDKKTIEELKNTVKKLQKELTEKEVNSAKELAKATSADAINELKMVQELKKERDRYKNENEQLRTGNQPEIKALRDNIKKLEKTLTDQELQSAKELAQATSADAVNELKVVKELKEQITKFQKENEDLKDKNRDLIISKSKDSQRKGEDFEKWFSEELLKVFDGRDNIKDISRGQTGTGKRADFLQEVLTDSEPKEVVGKIVYETKNAEKWENSWITKLEKDMQTEGAEFGFIVATCANDKLIRLAETIDPRKKIYISDDNNNLFLVIKAIRELLIIKHKLMKIDNVTDKEQKLRKIEEWAINKLPQYILNLEKQFEKQESATDAIIKNTEKLKKSKEEIYKLTMDNIVSEVKQYLF